MTLKGKEKQKLRSPRIRSSVGDDPPKEMRLTAPQKDALTELLNIGYARAAGALSDLTGQRITLAVPHVTLHRLDRITPALQEVVEGEVICVNQMFGGPICGNAILLFEESAAVILAQLLTGGPKQAKLDATTREVITEVGNIVLNACLGSFANMMEMNIKFTVPQLAVDEVQGILKSMRIAEERLTYAMMVRTRFDVRASNVSGFLVILLGVTHLEALIKSVEKWN
jgi:chemotaxis protein CheC